MIMNAHVRKSQKIKCQICDKDFSITDLEVHHKIYESGIEDDYFTCPHCGFEYIALHTDIESRAWSKQRDDLLYEIQRISLGKDREALINKYNDLVKKIRAKSKELKGY